MSTLPPRPLPSLEQDSPALTDLEEGSKRRLLLHEVLLEEYASLPQPPLDEQKLQAIRTDGERYRAECDKMNETDREEFEKAFSAELFSRINDLMCEAQTRVATDTLAELKAQYSDIYDYVEDPARREEVVDRAIAADIYGWRDDWWNEFWDKHSYIDDETERIRRTKEAVNRMIRGRVATGSGPVQAADGDGDGDSKKDDDRDGEDKIRADYAQTLRSALCLSGGGIRSATFNLGILQGLARHGLLEKFDYLSTVSGGGFAGGWLTAWIHRRGMREVMQNLKEPLERPPTIADVLDHKAKPPNGSPRTSLAPDPKPVEQLRVYSNYLSPRPGLLSADTWTLLSMVLRNLLLTWLVFVPWLIAGLMVPRMLVMILLLRNRPGFPLWGKWTLLSLGFAGIVWAFTYIGLALPVANSGPHAPNPGTKQGRQNRFIFFCLCPMVAGSIALAAYGAFPGLAGTLLTYLLFATAIIIIPWIACALKIGRNLKAQQSGAGASKNPFDTSRFVKSTLSIILAQAVLGCLLWYAATTLQPLLIPAHPLLYASFAVPLLLIFLSLSGTLISGFTSRYTNDEDQEWWGRSGAWVLIVAFIWLAVHLLVLYGPLMILGMSLQWRSWDWSNIWRILGTIAGIISGIITLYGGFSHKTPAHEGEPRRAGVGGKIMSSLASLVAPIFMAFLVILITLGTNWLLTSGPGDWLCQGLSSSCSMPAPVEHVALLTLIPFRYLLAAAIILGIFGSFMGRLINTNAFSPHYMWRNRIIRAYLGASREVRHPNPFTGFDTYDNLQMYELRPQPTEVGPAPPRAGRPSSDLPSEAQPAKRKLLHLLNMALNLAGGDKLQWQDRKAESFTVSPLHAGCYWLGYRRAEEYGGEEGISLGTSVAISGAFVSPNMGYMLTSPVVRFLMTLFNVRFGWWLGNPGRAGDVTTRFERFMIQLGRIVKVPVSRPFELGSPRLSVLPIVQEAFGQTNDQASYVYLSDGGHFENLGLYEMVLRRCRFIVVCDASSDAQYSFDSLAMAIRQIRVDFGVPIDIPEMMISTPSQNLKNKYCAIGRIRYSCVDRDRNNPVHQRMKDADFDGTLIVIKASMIGQEPRDVINYGQSSKDFPQETIVDQWFTEAQFESYRALGSHIIDAICGGDRNQVSLSAFARKVREHNQLNFQAFQEEINYATFAEQVKEIMEQRPVAYASYKRKVRAYLNKLLR